MRAFRVPCRFCSPCPAVLALVAVVLVSRTHARRCSDNLACLASLALPQIAGHQVPAHTPHATFITQRPSFARSDNIGTPAIDLHHPPFPPKASMASRTLESRFERMSVQDENGDVAKAYSSSKSKVRRAICTSSQSLSRANRHVTPSRLSSRRVHRSSHRAAAARISTRSHSSRRARTQSPQSRCRHKPLSARAIPQHLLHESPYHPAPLAPHKTMAKRQVPSQPW